MSINTQYKNAAGSLESTVRRYVIDYHDGKACYNMETTAIIPPVMGEYAVTGNILSVYAAQGYTVYSIYELCDGYGNEYIKELLRVNPNEAYNHIRLIYFDMSKGLE